MEKSDDKPEMEYVEMWNMKSSELVIALWGGESYKCRLCRIGAGLSIGFAVVVGNVLTAFSPQSVALERGLRKR